MNEIRRVLKQASGRLLLIDLLRTLAVTLSAGVGGLIAALFAERVFGVQIGFPGDWLRMGAVLAGVGVAAAVVWTLARRARGIALARELDERADLKETLSTAMWAADSDDPWSRAVLDTARERAVGVDVRRAIPITAPRLWPLPMAMALALTILWFSVPYWDVLGLLSERKQVAEREQATVQAVAEVSEMDKKLEEKLRGLGLDNLLDEASEAEASEATKEQDPDAIRRAAVRKFTNVTDKLNALKDGDKAQQLQALKDAMKQLKQPGPGPLDQLSKSLQQGNFEKAQEDLNELSKQLANESMGAEQKEQLQQQIKKLQEQMEKLAEDRSAIEKQLEKAGIPKEQAKKLAADPEAMKQALEKLESLSEEQKQQLMKQAQAQNAACKACSGMSESLGQMAAGMSPEGMSAEGLEGMEGLAGQLGEMEMAAMELDALDAASQEAMKQLAKMAGMCEGGNCNNPGDGQGQGEGLSPWRAGETAGRLGNGSGGPGQGNGMSPEEIDSPVSIEKTMAKSKQGNGPIIGRRLVYGEQVRGESRAEFQDATESSAKAAAEAISENQVAKELQPAVKHYFGRLEARGKKQAP